LSVEKREFQKAKVIDEIIKDSSLRGVEVAIGLFTGGTDEIEISNESHRPREISKDLHKRG
jgi:2-keto-3-deoxy-6-phosphogluconate aldolase